MNRNSEQGPLLNTPEAANYLGFSPVTLNNSRYTGLLGGVAAPAYIKVGKKSVFYKRSTLDNWQSQFKEQSSTSETPNNAA